MASNPLIDCRGLSKTFGSGSAAVQALRPTDLQVERGESVALTGPSGSGKSTLLYLLGTLEEPSAGHLHVDGQDLERLSPAQAAAYRNQTVGFVFQSFNLVPSIDALDNVALPSRLAGQSPSRARTRAAELLSRVGLEKRLHARPETLSGGQQQRVALARALINRPPLVLADEPTGNLDRSSGDAVLGLLQQLVAEDKVTLVMATHSQRACAIAHRVLRLSDGRLGGADANGTD